MPGTAPPVSLTTQLYQAGAGAGKTRKLTETIISSAQKFRSDRGRFPRIVVTTFTRKATQELRERLMLKADEIGDPELTAFLVSPSFVHISTIHGVFHTFLARYGHRFGIDPAFDVIEERENLHLARRALKRVIFNRDEYQNLLEDYDVNMLTGMLVGFYDATMGQKSIRAMSEKDLHESVAAHAKELIQKTTRVAGLIESETADPKWTAFAGDLKRIAAELAHADWAKGRDGVIAALTGFRKPPFKKDSPAVPAATNEATESLLKEIKELGDEAFDPAHWQNFFSVIHEFDPLARDFMAEFQQLKRQEGVLSMSDLELVTMEGIRQHPETARAFSEEWDYWLIDEFQDTSPLQSRALTEMIGGSAYFVVGDPQQSIYLFRGARSEVFREQRARIEAARGELHSLSVNYRSTTELVKFFNAFFTSLSPAFRAMESPAQDKSRFEIPVKFFKAPDEQSELAGITEYIKGLLAAGEPPESICVLGRTHDALSKVAAKLYEAHVPSFLHSNTGFSERREIQDALSLLKFLANPNDNMNLVRLLRSPWYRVEDAVLVRELAASPPSYWGRMKELEHPTVALLKSMLAQSRQTGVTHVFTEAIALHGPVDFSLAYDGSGRRESNLWKLTTMLAEAQCEPDFNLLDFISDYSGETRSAEFTEESDAVAALEPRRVNLMTVHRSKGLQFRHVVIPDMNRTPRNPSSAPFLVDEARDIWMVAVQIGDDPKRAHSFAGKAALKRRREHELEESDRVLYVAMTRAKETLFLSWSGAPKKNSWVDRMKWLLDTGKHKRDGFTYEVLDLIEPAAGYVAPTASGFEPRAAFRAVDGVTSDGSVSELLEKFDFGADSLARATSRLKKSLDGVLVHSVFESLRYANVISPEVLKIRFGERAGQIQNAIEYVKGLHEVPVAQLLKSGHVEWGFVFTEAGRRFRGRIDLWGKAGDGAWIVDYKTGDPARVEDAIDQLNIYSLAIRRSGVTGPIKLSVIFPLSETVHVEDAMSERDVITKFFAPLEN